MIMGFCVCVATLLATAYIVIVASIAFVKAYEA